MLKKNKDYVEFTLQYTSVDWARSKDCPEVCLKGYSDFSFPGVPIMDVVCNEFDHKVVVVSKRDFDRLQADNQHYRKLAKQREEDYKALLDKTGFYNLADLMCYLPKDKTLKGMIDSYETENEKLKKELYEFDPMPDYKELLKELYSTEDVEKLEWTLNHICGGKASANGWMVTAKLWRRNYETLSKLIGFSSVEEIQDYLTNEAECDTLHEAISKLKDQVKYTCDEWYSANSRNNSWKAAAECNSPKELIEKRETIEKEIQVYSRTLNEWKEGTGCPSPSAAKTLIESGISWHHAYRDVKVENEKLTDDVKSWKNVTGYSTPEDYMHARINNATPFDYTASWQTATGCVTPDQVKSRIEGLENAVRLTNRNMIKEIERNIDEWQKATGCSTPEQAKERIKALNERIDESEADYNHLLCTTGFESEGEIEDALDKCDHSTLRKALVDYEFDYEALLKFTGYKSEHDIRVMLNGEKYQYKTMRELISSLERKVKFTESNWQKATGCDTPDVAEERIRHYKNRLSNAVQAASCAAKHLDNITF